MRRKRLVVALVPLAGLAMICLAALCWPRPVRFTEDMDGRLRAGMTEAEVVAALGRPAGDYTGGESVTWDSSPMDLRRRPQGITMLDGSTAKGWISSTGYVAVRFGPDGRVVWHLWVGVFTPTQSSWWEEFRRSLGW